MRDLTIELDELRVVVAIALAEAVALGRHGVDVIKGDLDDYQGMRAVGVTAEFGMPSR